MSDDDEDDEDYTKLRLKYITYRLKNNNITYKRTDVVHSSLNWLDFVLAKQTSKLQLATAVVPSDQRDESKLPYKCCHSACEATTVYVGYCNNFSVKAKLSC